jgi:TonB family protein
MESSMTCRVAVVLAISALVSLASAQKPSDCPPRTVINNGVCIGKDGTDCSKQAQSSICYDAEPQYTDEAAKANVKGTVRLTATVRRDGCANDIKIVGSLGYRLDEAAVSALERYRFRKPPKSISINVEFNFDPQLSSRNPVTAPKCEEVARRSSSRE